MTGGTPGTWQPFGRIQHGKYGTKIVTFQTTNAVNQVIADYPIPANDLVVIDAIVRGNKADTNDGVSGKLSGTYKRNGTGNIVHVGINDTSIKKMVLLQTRLV